VSSTRSTSTLFSKIESVSTCASTEPSAHEIPEPSISSGALQDITNTKKKLATNVQQAAKKSENMADVAISNKSSGFFGNDDLIDLSDHGTTTQQQTPTPSKMPREDDPWAITRRPEQTLRDPYDILGIQWGASIDE
jgi:DNA polymerase III alpha subunit